MIRVTNLVGCGSGHLGRVIRDYQEYQDGNDNNDHYVTEAFTIPSKGVIVSTIFTRGDNTPNILSCTYGGVGLTIPANAIVDNNQHRIALAWGEFDYTGVAALIRWNLSGNSGNSSEWAINNYLLTEYLNPTPVDTFARDNGNGSTGYTITLNCLNGGMLLYHYTNSNSVSRATFSNATVDFPQQTGSWYHTAAAKQPWRDESNTEIVSHGAARSLWCAGSWR